MIYLVSYMCQDENRRQVAELIRAYFAIEEKSWQEYEKYVDLSYLKLNLLNLNAWKGILEKRSSDGTC